MAVTPGSRVGVYEVTAQIGAGAMGVVFKARDTKLLREVALKVLPEHFADDPDRLSRLQREAQLLASLNHPNIAHVYGLEQVGSGACIVMEFVAGETLADRLAHGPIPLDDAVGIAKQIAQALAAAHQQGIVHRDLKPANIKLTANGTVKVLDFGLAKPIAASARGSGSSMLPTMVSGSGVGTITGTVAYMSPEQARGKEVDTRTDIWAFGCVLYEMLVGRPAFDGETPTDIIAKVVTGQPDFAALPAGTPAPIRFLLAATLNKNIAQRLQHIGDAALFLDQGAFPAAGPPAAPSQSRSTRTLAVIGAAAVVVLAAALGAAALYLRSGAPRVGPAMMFQIALPGFVAGTGVSSDAKHVVFMAEPRGEKRALWIRTISSEAVQKIPGSDNPLGAAGSEDGQWVAFVADKKLKKFDTVSGSVQTIADFDGVVRGLSWAHGVILVATNTGLVRVSDEGGAFTPVTELDKKHRENAHFMPVFLPDGNHFLYAIISDPELPQNSGFFVGSLDGKTKTRLAPLGTRLNGLAYAPPGYLLISGESLTAQRFDASTLTLSGAPVQIADAVDGFGVSNTGLLLYRKSSGNAADKQLAWFDRAGRQLEPLGPKGNYGNVELSPTGDRVAVDMAVDGNSDVWVIDVARGVPSRITFAQSREWTPVWSPDGSRLAFGSGRDRGSHTYQKSAAGVGVETPMFKSDASEIPVAWSHDGRYIVFSRLKGPNGGGVDTWLMDLSGEPKASPYLESPFDKAQARISPDGRWLAYTTNDSGMYQIVVQSFPDPNRGRWQITAQGGIEPKWRHDGRELYYLALDGNVMAVPITETKPGQPFEAGAAVRLFQTPLTVSRTDVPRNRRYDVAPDGRFLIAMPVAAGGPEPVTAVVNWASGLEKR
jgi:Tol biopolymer transport system component/tRNA A-37 threonylcarbamoyl transferase component Bud32